MRRIAMLCIVVIVTAACSSEMTPASTTTSRAGTTTEATTSQASTTAATTTTTVAEPSTVPTFDGPVTFELAVQDETTPALASSGGGWDASFSYSPWVVHDNGTFHMFYTGWGVSVAVGYAVSEDGLTFTRVGDEPVLSIREDIGGRTHFAEAPVVYVAEDGTWVMYFGLIQGKRFPGKSIHRATAPAPEGPWTVDAEPIYEAEAGMWDDEAVPQSVVATDAGVFLFYDGRDGSNAESGVLFSEDGVQFLPFDDPDTPYRSDPILGVAGTQAWDGAGAGSPVVLTTPRGGLEMFYVGFEGPESAERVLRIGYAVSADGREWLRYSQNPVLTIDTQSSAPNSLGFPWMGGLEVEGTYYLYYALSAGAEGIGVITGTVER